MKKIIALTFLILAFLPPHAVSASDRTAHPVDGWLKAYQQFDLDGFLAFYKQDVRFTDPTARLDFTSRVQLASAYTGIMQGRYGGNFVFDVRNSVTQGDVVVLEGLFSLTWNGQKAAINFTTWLFFENGKISRQLDMFDYNNLQRQLPTYGQGVPSEYTGK